MDDATRKALESFRISNRKPIEAAASSLPEEAPLKIPGPIQVENFPGGEFTPEPAADSPEMANLKAKFGGFTIPAPSVAGPSIVYPNEIDDKESGAIDTLDRVLALNVGDPTGSYNKLKNKYGPRGYEFSQSTDGDIVFKSPNATGWSRLDPGEKDPNVVTSLGGLAPNKMYTGDAKEFGRDVVDALPDVAQGTATGLMGTIGALAAGRTGMTLGAGLAGGMGETLRQTAGKVTGYREGPFDPAKIAIQAGIDAAIPNIFGSGASKKQIEEAVTKRGLASTVWDSLTGSKSEPIDRGVEILNKASKGLTDPKLPPELVGDAVKQFKDDTVGLVPGLASAGWNKLSRMAPETKVRAFKQIKPAALDLLKRAGVKFGLGRKAPKDLAEAAPFISEQGMAGEVVKIIQNDALEARAKKLAESGQEIESALSKLTKKIDLSDERNIFDDAIADLEASKTRDPMKATQIDKLIASVKASREQLFGAPDDGLPIEDLRKEAVDVLTATARKGKASGYGLGDMLYTTPEAATGRLKEAVKAVDAMTPEELSAAAGMPIPKDTLGTPMSPPPISKEARNKIIENTYFKMFGVKPPRPDLPKDLPEGLDARGARIWATAKAKKMSRSELLKAAGKYPGKSAEVDPDIAWSKFLTLKDMAKYRKVSDNPDLVNSQIQALAIKAERSLNDKMYKQLNNVAGKDLSKQYKVYVNGDEDTANLLGTINQGLSTAGKAFIDEKSYVLKALKDYDDLYGTNLVDQLEVLAVAKDFGTKGDWFPKSGSGATSTGIVLEGQAMGGTAGSAAAAAAGLGPTGAGLLQSAGQVLGSAAGSGAAVRRAARLGNVLDQVYGRAGGDWNPVSTGQLLGSPWMNLDNTDQNKKLLKERYKE